MPAQVGPPEHNNHDNTSMSSSKRQEPLSRATWEMRALIGEAQAHALVARMRASDLPLASPSHDEAGESDSSKITALISFVNGQADAYVATPSGLLYRFAPPEFEAHWWSVALRYYHVVTGNMADRLRLAELAGVDPAQIKGKCLSRLKCTALSGLSLEQILDQACPTQQSSLFD